MTIKFHSNIVPLVVGRGILGGGFTLATGISIYSGTQPLAADIVANWSTHNSTNANFLAHYKDVTWSHPLNGNATYCTLTSAPIDVMPTNPGTGEWCIMWSTNPTNAALASSTIPTDKFLVCSVTSLQYSGVIRFNPDAVFVTDTIKEIADGLITVAIV